MRTSKHEQARYGWLRPSQMAKEVGLNAETIRQFIRSGELPAHNFGSARRPDYRVVPEDWQTFKESRKVRAA